MKRAIIFGSSGGISKAICSDLAADGWSLYLHCNHHLQTAENLAQELMEKYPAQDFIPVQFDFLADQTKLKQFVNSLLPVNAAVFATGITKYGFLSKQSLTDVEELVKVNLTVPIEITNLLEPVLLKQDFSRIVYLGSVYGGQGSALESVYSATKAGLSRFSQAYAREVASAKLTVNVIAPGAVDTPMNHILSQETMAEVKDEIPSGRLADGHDVSFWVRNLLDEKSSYCTGQTIYVTGGWLV